MNRYRYLTELLPPRTIFLGEGGCSIDVRTLYYEKSTAPLDRAKKELERVGDMLGANLIDDLEAKPRTGSTLIDFTCKYYFIPGHNL